MEWTLHVVLLKARYSSRKFMHGRHAALMHTPHAASVHGHHAAPTKVSLSKT
jgi:hypothetical protein